MRGFIFIACAGLYSSFCGSVFAATVATFETGATWSIKLTSAVSKLNGTDVTDEIVGAPPLVGEDEDGFSLWIEDGPSAGGSGYVDFTSIGDENTGAWVVSNGVAGSDGTADGKYVSAGRGFERASAWGYRRECDPALSSSSSSCSDDPGVDLTFSYEYEARAGIEVPDLIAPHQASASVKPIISFNVASFYGNGVATNLLRYNELLSLSSGGTNLSQVETDIFSGTFFVSLAPGIAFSSYANVNYYGRVNLASTPAPVPLPASALFLLSAAGGLLLRARRRARY